MCQQVADNPGRRSAERCDLIVPPTKTVCCGARSFTVARPSTWNSLQALLRNSQLCLMSFRRHLKTELFSRAIGTLVTVMSGRISTLRNWTKLSAVYSISKTSLWTPAQRKRASMLYFADVLFIYLFFYGRLILRPWLTEVRESFTRGGSCVSLKKLLLGFFFWPSLNYRVGQKVTKFRIFSDPARKLSALTPERGRIL